MAISYTTYTGTAGAAEPRTVTRHSLKDSEVFVKTTHSGLCGTDLHYYHAGIGLGHEGAGVVVEVGAAVTHLKVGDRVGWGWITGSCGVCSQCRSGYINACENASQYGAASTDQGSFSTGAVWDSRYVYRIPDEISSADAAPLLCGGWTVWNALVGYNLKSTDHIGVIGIGGLGHLALQFANKMGCEVTAFSGTEEKKTEALNLGATHFVATKGLEKLEVSRPIDRLIITTNAHIDWTMYLPILAGRASVFPLQIPSDMSAPLVIPHLPFLMKSINVIYSTNGRHDEYEKMLGFAALHGIRPVVELFEMSVEGIETAIERLEGGKMRYRGVLAVKD